MRGMSPVYSAGRGSRDTRAHGGRWGTSSGCCRSVVTLSSRKSGLGTHDSTSKGSDENSKADVVCAKTRAYDKGYQAVGC